MAEASATGANGAISRRQHAAHIVVVLGGSVLSASSAMISVTITPTTVLDIGGVEAISWTTTLYVVASIVAAAGGGLLRVRFGLRRAALLGPMIFALGGLVCAAAPVIGVLLAGRLLQGLGAGLALALSYACIRILFPERQWPRMFALISAVWAVAALSGPLVGAGL
ncbi:MAG: MFS transporter, partial [Pseudomonadota bacterium]